MSTPEQQQRAHAALYESLAANIANILAMQREDARKPIVHVTPDSDGGVTLTADVPGSGDNDIKMHVEGTKLEIKGTSRSAQNPGDFDEFLDLPQGVDAHGATSQISNGVLTMKFPPLRVDIPSGGN